MTDYQPTAFERLYDPGMRLRRTRRGWAEPRPTRCPGCGARWGPDLILVGSAQCRCASTHRTVQCRGCDETFFYPRLLTTCRPQALDGRASGR